MKRYKVLLPILGTLAGLAIIFLLAGIPARGMQPAYAAAARVPNTAIVVDTLEDELNSDGDCSLREAVTSANTNAAVDACTSGVAVITDTITFSVAGTITVTSQLSVTAGGPLVIDGGGAITVSGNHSVRVLYIEIGSIVNFKNLTISDGYLPGGSGGGLNNNGGVIIILNSSIIHNDTLLCDIDMCYGEGGGLYNHNRGAMIIIDSSLINNVANDGHAVLNQGGTLEVTNSIISGIYPLGASITNRAIVEPDLITATMALSGSTIINNRTGLKNLGIMTVSNSTIISNEIGIYNLGLATVTSTSINNNETGILNHNDLPNNFITATLTVFGSTITDNMNGISNGATLTLTNCTINNNGDIDTFGGAGINIVNGTVKLINNTISGNVAEYGGGIRVDSWNSSSSTNISIFNSTITGNTAVYEGNAVYIGSLHGEVSITFSGSIVAGDTLTVTNCSQAEGPNVFSSLGYNLEDGDSCQFSEPSDMTDTVPMLGPLQDNGGPTWTQALLEGSPAIDAGDNDQCPPIDQRGVLRPFDGDRDGVAVCDIGAYEYAVYVNPTLVTILGPENGWIGESKIFTATVEPVSTTLPLTYTWQATGQDPVTHTGGITDTVTFTWQSPGNQVITVTATNVAGYVMDAHAITITNPSYIVYLPAILKEPQPGSLIEAVITTQGYELSFPNQYFVYGYVRNLTTEPLYDVFIHFEVTWYCSSDDLGNTGISNVTPVLTATLPGQLNPYAISIFEIKNCYPSIGPIVGISANPWVSGEEYYPLTITGYDYVDSTVSGTVRNDSHKLLQHARVAGLLPEPQLGEYQGNRYCGPVEAALDTDTLLPGQETSFTIGYFNCDVDDSLIVVGQGAYQP